VTDAIIQIVSKYHILRISVKQFKLHALTSHRVIGASRSTRIF
jgi:hypothetical protein